MNTLEEIENEWEKDAQDFKDNPDKFDTIMAIPILHSKYSRVLSRERLMAAKLLREYKELYNEKYVHYFDGPTKETIEKGWKMPPKGKVAKVDMERMLDADPDLGLIEKRQELSKAKIEKLIYIMKQVHELQWISGRALDWQKFLHAGMNS